MRHFLIKANTWQQMLETVALREPESGGIIGGSGNVVSCFHFDTLAATDANSYDPDTSSLNEVIQSWQLDGVHFLGIVHSHHQFPLYPSTNDLAYARDILKLNRRALKQIIFVLIIFPFTTFEESVYSFFITRRKCFKVQPRIIA